uniref:Uncharacterized protein n=1 Tax=Acrobeloides nanus TaxID=290746 RepID=A0A914CGR5_9BILA
MERPDDDARFSDSSDDYSSLNIPNIPGYEWADTMHDYTSSDLVERNGSVDHVVCDGGVRVDFLQQHDIAGETTCALLDYTSSDSVERKESCDHVARVGNANDNDFGAYGEDAPADLLHECTKFLNEPVDGIERDDVFGAFDEWNEEDLEEMSESIELICAQLTSKSGSHNGSRKSNRHKPY